MTIKQIEKKCMLIWGKSWQTGLARYLKRDARTVRYWVSGEYDVPHYVSQLVDKALEDHKKKIDKCVDNVS